VAASVRYDEEQTRKAIRTAYLKVFGTGAAVLTLAWAGLMLGRRRRHG
jgi:hypothetical protein